MPDLGHDAYWFAKQIRELVWRSKAGEEAVGKGDDRVGRLRSAPVKMDAEASGSSRP
jgi:hypothetical protein